MATVRSVAIFERTSLDKLSPIEDRVPVLELRQTETFAAWFRALRDKPARARVQVRIDRLSLGNPGDVKPVGEGVAELRIDYGPVYRVYFLRRGAMQVVLLAGGDKGTQSQDIGTALELARSLRRI
jgi:putative addiction module killer protein